MTPEEKQDHLLEILRSMGRAVVAFSGGVDSTYLAKAAHVALGDMALAVTARSPSYPEAEFTAAVKLAQAIGIQHEVIETDELNDPNYAANPSNRCYFCKSELFDKLVPLAQERGIAWVVYGAIADDRSDFRPGMQAAREHERVRAPLEEADLTKAEIRELSHKWGLPTWDKPSFACLASRIQYGDAITREKLNEVEAAEDFLRRRGFRQFRVRRHDSLARIELPPEDLPRLVEEDLRRELTAYFRSLGYAYVTLDLMGFRSGSMNETLAPPQSHIQNLKSNEPITKSQQGKSKI